MMEVDDREYCSCEMERGGDHRWTAHDRRVIARMEQYLNGSESMKVEIEELEGSEESEAYGDERKR